MLDKLLYNGLKHPIARRIPLTLFRFFFILNMLKLRFTCRNFIFYNQFQDMHIVVHTMRTQLTHLSFV